MPDEQALGGRMASGEGRMSSETEAGLAPRSGTYLTIDVARYDPPESASIVDSGALPCNKR
jgi:hypothetical protein